MFEQIVTGWACDTRCLYFEGNSLKTNTTNLKSSKHFFFDLEKFEISGDFPMKTVFFRNYFFKKNY